MELLDVLKDYNNEMEKVKWEGNFAEYIELVRQNPKITQNAHSRVYNMIIEAGVEKLPNGLKRYKFFESELFGMEETIQKLVEEYFYPAALGLDVKKRMLLMMGPVSSGKSTIATLIKKGMEKYSRTDDGAVYAIKGCPMQQEPLLMIPHELRPKFEKELGVKINGELNPYTRLMIEEQYQGDIENVRVERIFLSEQKRKGIGTFSPSDPKSQDIADLVGSIDFAAISEYGSESDPRAYRFDGELNIANRGVVEFQEVLKCDEKFLWHLLSLTQEGNFKASRFALISADEVILAHTNETEYRSFISNDKNEALRSRMIVVHTPYNLKASDEEKVYEKSIKQNGLDINLFAPLALRTVAEFSVLTRLKEGDYINLIDKMKLYDGIETEQFGFEDLEKEKNISEGMFGIDPRFIINRISYVASKCNGDPVDGLELLKEIEKGLDEHPSIKDEKRKEYKKHLQLALKEYNQKLKESFEDFLYKREDAAIMFNNYINNIENYCNQKECDEEFMRSIEEVIGISKNARKAFREEVLIKMSSYIRKGKTFDFETHPLLKKAIKTRLISKVKEVVELSDEKLREISINYAEQNQCSPDSALKMVRQITDSISKTA